MTEISQITAETVLLTGIQTKIDTALNNCLASYDFETYIQKQALCQSPLVANETLFTLFTHELNNAQKLTLSQTAYKQLISALEYSVFSGGKRIRPILCLLVANYCQALLSCQNAGNKETDATISKNEALSKLSLQLAVAIELIHSYSLVHDDLPAMDNAIYRRGKLTVHKQFGEAVAILVGDALLTLAFSQLSQVKVDLDLATYKRIMFVQTELVHLAGLNGMVAGQMLDLATSPVNCTLADYLACISGKTAALLQAAICLPAKLNANLSKNSEKDLAQIAYSWGVLFQIQDDRLDKADLDHEKNILNYISAAELSIWEKQLNDSVQSRLQTLFLNERKRLHSCSHEQLSALDLAENTLFAVLKKLERRKQ